MGQLSRTDINNENGCGGLKIIPCKDVHKKAASYDITPSIVAMSAKVGMLENVYREPRYNSDRYYIRVRAKDTVLIVSNEYLIIPNNIAGYVSSRVSKLVEGFGHISTTIDPNWKGAALIALSNPSNYPLKVYVGACGDESGETQLATVTFHYLHTECESEDIENVHKGMRLDLLEKVMYKNKTGFRACVRNLFYYRRRRFTDYFFSACEDRYKKIDEEVWKKFLQEFSSFQTEVQDGGNNKKVSKKAQLRAVDFIITENVLTRIIYFLERRKQEIAVMFIIIMFVLAKIGVIPQEWIDAVIAFFAIF